MIRTTALRKTFAAAGGGEVVALDGVDLRVPRGEFLAVVGPSGSGKSTLLFALGALAAPTSGEVWLGERRIDDLGFAERAALRRELVGFVFQTFNLVPYLTCEENVALPALLARRTRAQAFAVAREMLDRLGLAPRRRHRPAELSVGERQRVGVGRALVNAPSLLLADEPTGNLDPAAAAEVMALFREVQRQGRTVVMVTHDPALAESADRVVHLRAGTVVEDRPAESRRMS